MLPCNVIVQQTLDGIEVAAVDPVASMQSMTNEGLKEIACEIQAKKSGCYVGKGFSVDNGKSAKTEIQVKSIETARLEDE